MSINLYFITVTITSRKYTEKGIKEGQQLEHAREYREYKEAEHIHRVRVM